VSRSDPGRADQSRRDSPLRVTATKAENETLAPAAGRKNGLLLWITLIRVKECDAFGIRLLGTKRWC